MWKNLVKWVVGNDVLRRVEVMALLESSDRHGSWLRHRLFGDSWRSFAIYVVLADLEADRFVTSSGSGEGSRLYHLTDRGRAVFAAYLAEIQAAGERERVA